LRVAKSWQISSRTAKFHQSVVNQKNDVIYCIRHGEKPDPDTGDLSDKGVQRAYFIADQVFNGKTFRIPDQIFTVKPKQKDKDGNTEETSKRMLQTVTPLALKINNVPILVSRGHKPSDDETHKETKKRKITKQLENIMANPDDNGTVTLVCWEHHILGKVLGALGANNDGTWDDSDFDSVWVAKRDPNHKKAWKWEQKNEKFPGTYALPSPSGGGINVLVEDFFSKQGPYATESDE